MLQRNSFSGFSKLVSDKRFVLDDFPSVSAATVAAAAGGACGHSPLDLEGHGVERRRRALLVAADTPLIGTTADRIIAIRMGLSV